MAYGVAQGVAYDRLSESITLFPHSPALVHIGRNRYFTVAGGALARVDQEAPWHGNER
jgi:hypothetical protein